MRGPRVAVLIGDGRAEPDCLLCLLAVETTGVVAFSGPAHEAVNDDNSNSTSPPLKEMAGAPLYSMYHTGRLF